MPNGSPHMQIFYMGSMCQLSPYAYGDLDQSPYAYGGSKDPRMCTGIAWHINPVCIRGSRSIPICIWGSRRSPFAYGDHMTKIPVCIWGFTRSQYAYGDISVTNRMHTGNISIWEIKSWIPICVILHTGIAVCIWGSPYVNGRGGLLKSSHKRIPVRIMKLCAYGD